MKFDSQTAVSLVGRHNSTQVESFNYVEWVVHAGDSLIIGSELSYPFDWQVCKRIIVYYLIRTIPFVWKNISIIEKSCTFQLKAIDLIFVVRDNYRTVWCRNKPLRLYFEKHIYITFRRDFLYCFWWFVYHNLRVFIVVINVICSKSLKMNNKKNKTKK